MEQTRYDLEDEIAQLNGDRRELAAKQVDAYRRQEQLTNTMRMLDIEQRELDQDKAGWSKKKSIQVLEAWVTAAGPFVKRGTESKAQGQKRNRKRALHMGHGLDAQEGLLCWKNGHAGHLLLPCGAPFGELPCNRAIGGGGRYTKGLSIDDTGICHFSILNW